MVRNLLLTIILVVTGAVVSFAQTELFGTVIDQDTKEPVMFANVSLTKNGVFVTGSQTDFDGKYSITGIESGTYDVEFSYVGYGTQHISDVDVYEGKANQLDAIMSAGIDLPDVIVTWDKPLVEKDNTTAGGIVTSKDIQNLPTKNIGAIVATVAGTSTSDEGDKISIRGARSDGTDYYIDGVRVSGNLIPQSEIEQLQVITGGMEAKYGDATGGIISITTRGPSDKFSGGIEAETSQYLDPFGYNLISGNVSGPILKKKGKSVLGFRFSGQYLGKKDDDPPAIPVYSIKDEALKALEANPVVIKNGAPIPAGQLITDDDVNRMDYKPNEEDVRYDVTGKLDARLGDAIDVTLSGNYSQEKDYFTPNFSAFLYSGSLYPSDKGRVFNSHNNPFSSTSMARGNFRFRHRLGGTKKSASTGEEVKESIFKNAMYVLQFGYQKYLYGTSDVHHEDRFFDYGYIGKFEADFLPSIKEPTSGEEKPVHDGYTEHFLGYTPGDKNPVLANYNNFLGDDVDSKDKYVAQNGNISDQYTDVWNLHDNVGRVFNRYRKKERDTYTGNLNVSFQVVPKGKGTHNIQLGLMYEEKVNRGYELKPEELWIVAGLNTNAHFNGLNRSKLLYDSIRIVNEDTTVIPIYAPLVSEPEDLLFYKNIRNVNGEAIDEYVNLDGFSPDQLSLDMFSAKELNDHYSRLGLEYHGYDYLGNKLTTDYTFNQFFTEKDADRIRTFPIGAWRPNYMAAFIQDKFKLDNIYLRLGLRVDRYDANTKVMKDPYSLYEIQTAKDFNEGQGRPGNIGDDFKVYVTSDNGNQVRAYRDGDQWYYPNGAPANDGREIFGGELVYPKYTVENPDIQARGFNPDISFEDYKPQINLMPRVAVSFPIGEEANFFAHYDILVQRPPVRSYASPLDYYYFGTRTGYKSNPNLKPEKTIDYEIGFQQKISDKSAIKMSAYYREMRDMIAARSYFFFPYPLNSYDTYGNSDFGTTKGFSFQYDLRRTNNVSMLVSYTLQFADGTGSNENSARGSESGIKTLFPLSFDERHRINLSLDYRYQSDDKYNGPELWGKQIFANTGVNIQTSAVSGRPYTAKKIPTELGGEGVIGAINGSRKPWNVTVGMKIDKDFTLSKSEKRPLYLNVYLRASNLLNRKNIISVYSASGSPSDSGFLASARGQDYLRGIRERGESVASYMSAFQWRVENSDYYSLPRRIYFGMVFNF